MANRLKPLINDQEAAYLKLLIVGADGAAAKNALQRLCQLYRSDYRLRDESEMRRILLGTLSHQDSKVVRWCLNALAFIAKPEDDRPIISAVSDHREDPDVLGAGVAALASLKSLDDLRASLDGIQLPLRGAALFAAAQQIKTLEPDLRKNRVSIDTDQYGDLRLATVLVGVNKAPENLFDSVHTNSVMMGQLNRHPDPMTAQYSIWAITERSDYGVNDLSISLSEVSSQVTNIRAYIYQLVAEDIETAKSEIDFIRQGISDDESQVRDHLARGLKGTYFEGLRDLTMNWYFNEEDSGTRVRILDHISSQSESDKEYLNFALELFKSDRITKIERAQIEASAGKTLGHEIRRFRYTQDSFEFAGGVAMSSKIEIHNLNAGAVAFDGNASNSGTTTMKVEQATREARKLARDILQAALSAKDPIPADVRGALDEAESKPTQSNLSKVMSWLKSGVQFSGALASAIGGVPEAVSSIEKILPYLPSS